MKMEETTKILKYFVALLVILVICVLIRDHAICRTNAELRYQLLVMQCENAETEHIANDLIFDLEKMEIDPYLADDKRCKVKGEVDRLRKEVVKRCESGDFQEVPDFSAIRGQIQGAMKDAFSRNPNSESWIIKELQNFSKHPSARDDRGTQTSYPNDVVPTYLDGRSAQAINI